MKVAYYKGCLASLSAKELDTVSSLNSLAALLAGERPQPIGSGECRDNRWAISYFGELYLILASGGRKPPGWPQASLSLVSTHGTYIPGSRCSRGSQGFGLGLGGWAMSS